MFCILSLLCELQVSVGFIGYPNVGKSSVINALRAKKVLDIIIFLGICASCFHVRLAFVGSSEIMSGSLS